MTYRQKLKDPRWQRKRLEILQRDDFTCLVCRATDRELHIHHHYYEPQGDPWDAPNGSLSTLCRPCHWDRQKQEDALRVTVGKILAESNREDIASLKRFLTKVLYGGASFCDAWYIAQQAGSTPTGLLSMEELERVYIAHTEARSKRSIRDTDDDQVDREDCGFGL